MITPPQTLRFYYLINFLQGQRFEELIVLSPWVARCLHLSMFSGILYLDDQVQWGQDPSVTHCSWDYRSVCIIRK